MEKAEMETTITYDVEERVARIFSAIKRDQTKLRKGGFTPSYGTAARGYGYQVPLSRLKWRITSGVPRKVGPGGFKSKKTTISQPSTDRKGAS